MNTSRSHSRFLLWPHSTAGAVSVALSALFLMVLGMNLGAAAAKQQNGFLVFATFLTALGALAGIMLSAVAIDRQRERSPLIFLSLVVGVMVFVFLAIEIIAGHN